MVGVSSQPFRVGPAFPGQEFENARAFLLFKLSEVGLAEKDEVVSLLLREFEEGDADLAMGRVADLISGQHGQLLFRFRREKQAEGNLPGAPQPQPHRTVQLPGVVPQAVDEAGDAEVRALGRPPQHGERGAHDPADRPDSQPADQPNAPLSNRPDNSPELLPSVPVSRMLGKNAARAAPMLALAAIIASNCLAWASGQCLRSVADTWPARPRHMATANTFAATFMCISPWMKAVDANK
mgnify:CR=1 FL=1